MPDRKELYFLALLPPGDIALKVHALKQEMADKYQSSYSLKIPEHITIIPPFFCKDDDLKKLSSFINDFAKTFSAFDLELKNFGHFSNRVIYIDAISHPVHLLEELYYSTKNMFGEKFSFLERLRLSDKFASHMTIANRDLKPPAFREAWKGFEGRKFNATFKAEYLFLLRLENGVWKTFEKYAFKP